MEPWHLDDAEARHRDNPRSFFIPGREVRARLEPGDAVKLIFLFEPRGPSGIAGERMWVEVESTTRDGYIGKLLTQPSVLTELSPGDLVAFGPHHVAAVGVDERTMGYRVDTKAILTHRLADADERPAYLRRDEPVSATDSGWQLFLGDETDDELSDTSRIGTADLGYLTDKFPELEPVFRAGRPGEVWTWNEVEGAYRRAE